MRLLTRMQGSRNQMTCSASINRAALITYWEGFPLWSVPCWYHVDLLIHLAMIMKQRCITMRSQSSSPQSKKVVNITGRHLVLAIEKASHLKFDLVRIWMPSETGFLADWLFYQDGIWVKGIACIYVDSVLANNFLPLGHTLSEKDWLLYATGWYLCQLSW